MAVVTLYPPITASRERLNVPGECTVRELFLALAGDFGEISGRLREWFDPENPDRLEEYLLIIVDGRPTSGDDRVAADSEVAVMAPLQGG